METLTRKQLEVLDLLRKYAKKNKLVPTHEEMGSKLGMARQNIAYHLRQLHSKGYITFSRKWRDIKIIN